MQNNTKQKQPKLLHSINIGLSQISLKEWLYSITIGIMIAACFGLLFSYLIVQDIAREQKVIAGRTLAHSSVVEGEVDYIFSYLQADNVKSCNPETLKTMQKIIYEASYVENIAIIKDDYIQCSGFNGVTTPTVKFEMNPDYIKPNGTEIWSRADIKVYHKTATFTVFRRNNILLFYDTYKTNEVIPGNYQWQISHRIYKKQHYFAGMTNPVFDTPVSNWWTLIKSWVPVYEFCNARNLQCIHLKINRWKLFVNQTIKTKLLLFAISLICLTSIYLSLRYFGWRKSLDTKILRALRGNKFHCYYQPIIDVNTKKTIGVEVLSRLNYKGQNITPDEFIPIISQHNVTWYFTKQIIQKAFNDLNRIPSLPRDFKVSINIFSSDVESGVVEEIIPMIETSSFKQKLLIEITESEYIEGEKAQIHLQNLHHAGIKIAIDDFGTGYSNMLQLEKIKCDILKIDRCFIKKIDSTNKGKQLIDHMVNIAHDNKMQVVAEGIENQQQMAKIKALGIEFVQGFMFAKPSDINELIEKLNHRDHVVLYKNKVQTTNLNAA
jgi:sensor c-di-GMP phosphodiesterase-like protein